MTTIIEEVEVDGRPFGLAHPGDPRRDPIGTGLWHALGAIGASVRHPALPVARTPWMSHRRAWAGRAAMLVAYGSASPCPGEKRLKAPCWMKSARWTGQHGTRSTCDEVAMGTARRGWSPRLVTGLLLASMVNCADFDKEGAASCRSDPSVGRSPSERVTTADRTCWVGTRLRPEWSYTRCLTPARPSRRCPWLSHTASSRHRNG